MRRGFPVFHKACPVEKPVYPPFAPPADRPRFPQSPPIGKPGKGCGNPKILYNCRFFARFAASGTRPRTAAWDNFSKRPGLQPIFQRPPPARPPEFSSATAPDLWNIRYVSRCTRGKSCATHRQIRLFHRFPATTATAATNYLIFLYIRRITLCFSLRGTDRALRFRRRAGERLRRADRRVGVVAFPEMQESGGIACRFVHKVFGWGALALQAAYQTAFGGLSAAGTRMPWHPVPRRAASAVLAVRLFTTCSRLISYVLL